MAKTILIFNEYYLPGYKAGGPIRSVSNIVSWLGDEFEFKIVTKDRDSFEKEPYEEIKVNEWNKVENAEVYYISEKDLGFKKLYGILKQTDYDAIYLNSVFNFWFSVIPLFLSTVLLDLDTSKILLVPRGELSEGALDQKTFKKKLFLTLLKILGIHKKINWQATNKEEKKEIKQYVNISDDQIYNASNLPQKLSNEQFRWVEKDEGRLRIIFLSRIARKKNLLGSLEILSDLNGINFVFDIYGPRDDRRYWNKCKEFINKHELSDKVFYKGIVEHSEVIRLFKNYDLFLFPTHGENFGHVILESLSAGCPVLTSTETPWQEVEENNAGWLIPAENKKKYVKAIHDIANANSSNRKKMRNNAFRVAKDKIENLDALKENKKMFKKIVTNSE